MTEATFAAIVNDAIADLLPRHLLPRDDAAAAIRWCEHWSAEHSDSAHDQPGLAARAAIGAWLDVQLMEVE